MKSLQMLKFHSSSAKLTHTLQVFVLSIQFTHPFIYRHAYMWYMYVLVFMFCLHYRRARQQDRWRHTHAICIP